MTEWFDDDDFWKDLYPVFWQEDRIEGSGRELDGVLELTGVKEGSVLDLCCGPGRHSILLAERGFEVTGVDRTGYLLEKAKERAEEKGVEVEWIKEDMRAFKRPASFDLAISMYASFGYFEDKNEDLQVLGNVFENLRSGGAFLLDIRGKEPLAKVFKPVDIFENDDILLICRHAICDDWSYSRNDWTLIKDGKRRDYTFRVNLHSGMEIKRLLQKAGFSSVALYGWYDGSPFDQKAKRLIAVARKSG